MKEDAFSIVLERLDMVKKGEVLSSLPKSPLPAATVEELETHDQVQMAEPLDTESEEETTRRIALQTSIGGYLVEYLPPNGWIVIRSVRRKDKTAEEISEAVMDLAADTASSESLNELMQAGYDLKDEGEYIEACERWLQVWEELKKRFTSEMTSIKDAERVFTGLQVLYNWCQDLEMHLLNAGNIEPRFHERRIEYCREFCELFPDTSTLIIQNMKAAAAVSLFALGRVEEGEHAFEALTTEHPDYGWGYIKWGDMYWDQDYDVPTDYDRAEELYRTVLSRDIEDQDAVRNRLDRLAEERSTQDPPE